jgi:hypothetical protein
MKKVRHGLKKFRGTLSPHTSFERSQNQQPSSRATSPTLAAVSSSISTQASQSSPAQENIGTSTSLADWWKTHRSGIISSVEKVFKVTAKVLELVPLAEPAVKAFETAGEVLEEVQVMNFYSQFFSMLPHACRLQRMWENVDTIRDLTREMDHLLRAIARCEQSGPLSQAMQARIAALKACVYLSFPLRPASPTTLSSSVSLQSMLTLGTSTRPSQPSFVLSTRRKSSRASQTFGTR